MAQAQSGTATEESGNAYTLRLEGSGESVVAFSDRPQRITENLSAEGFFGTDWDESFADDPPNAALDLLEEGGSAAVWIFELENPRLSGSSLTFVAELLDEATEGLAHYAGRTDEGPPARFDAASLFIDSGGGPDCEGAFIIIDYIDELEGVSCDVALAMAITVEKEARRPGDPCRPRSQSFGEHGDWLIMPKFPGCSFREDVPGDGFFIAVYSGG